MRRMILRRFPLAVFIGFAISIIIALTFAYTPIQIINATRKLSMIGNFAGLSWDTIGTTHIEVVSQEVIKTETVKFARQKQGWILAQAMPEAIAAHQNDGQDTYLLGFGWPFRCTWCIVRGGWSPQFKLNAVAGAIEVGRKQVRAIDTPRLLPFQMLWRGLALNALVYACVSFFLMLGVRAVRRRLRWRRGQCPECGYDRRGNLGATCPECGSLLKD